MLADSVLAMMSDNSPSELNIRSDPTRHGCAQRSGTDTDLKSIFTPLGDFLHMLGVSLPFGRKPKLNADRFPNLYESSLHKEHIELVQFSLVEIGEPVEAGIGHSFALVELRTPTWCDFCGDFLWGVHKLQHCVQCQYCNYTCHMRCSAHVTLNCNSPSIAPERPEDYNAATSDAATLPMDAVHFGESGERLLVSAPIRCQELQRKLSAYNASASPGKEMILSEDGQSVSGFIRVHMNLCRPINVVSESKPLSLHNIIHPTADGIAEKTLTSFYLPRDTIKALHVHSSSTTQEVISALLKKFKVADNPRKYALYERYYDNRDSMKVKMRRLQDIEHPLLLALMCGEMQESTAQHQQQFVLQENETGDISWDAFSLPELNNFLKILQREEEEYQNQVRLKYKYIQTKLQEVIDQWISVNQQQQDVTGDFECSDANGVASGVIDKDEEQSESSSENTNEECKDAFPQQSFTTAPGLYPGFRTSSQLLDVS